MLADETNFVVYNVYDLRADKALSSLDTRHNFVLSYNYELPFGAGKLLGSSLSGVAERLVGGWQINGIVTARTGIPQTALITFNNARSRPVVPPDRPDLLPGKSNNPTEGVTGGCPGVPAGQKLGGPDLYFDPCSFTVPPPGFFGNTARNTITQPGLLSWNFSIFKHVPVTESQNVEFRAEFFNLFNRPNFGRSTSQIFTTATGAVNPSVGRITTTVTTSRQIQFGLKYTF